MNITYHPIMPSAMAAIHTAKINNTTPASEASKWSMRQREKASNECCKNLCYYVGLLLLLVGILVLIMGIAFAVKYPLPAIGFAVLLVGLTVMGDYCGCR